MRAGSGSQYVRKETIQHSKATVNQKFFIVCLASVNSLLVSQAWRIAHTRGAVLALARVPPLLPVVHYVLLPFAVLYASTFVMVPIVRAWRNALVNEAIQRENEARRNAAAVRVPHPVCPLIMDGLPSLRHPEDR
jgi:hypothetical protein